MPTFKTGNMWDAFYQVDHFIFTANSTIKSGDRLVMGAGIAKTVRDKIPGMDKKFGQVVQTSCKSGGLYFLKVIGKIGALQVKRNYWEQADLDIIRQSLNELAAMAKMHSSKTFALNYPGIGKGGLSKESVEPLLAVLPPNVEVWTFHDPNFKPRQHKQPKPDNTIYRNPMRHAA